MERSPFRIDGFGDGEQIGLIIGIDFSSGAGNSDQVEQVLSTIGRYISSFSADGLIPAFGFGDDSTRDRDVFSFNRGGDLCPGIDQALERFREISSKITAGDSRSYLPFAETAMAIVKQNGDLLNVVLIITPGPVTFSSDSRDGNSPEEQSLFDLLWKTQHFPSFVMFVGVGDGPFTLIDWLNSWIQNVGFISFTEMGGYTEMVYSKVRAYLRGASFRYRTARQENGIFLEAEIPQRNYLPPPDCSSAVSGNSNKSSVAEMVASTSRSLPSSSNTDFLEDVRCPVCCVRKKNVAFGCGHRICLDCSVKVASCPLCRSMIHLRIMLYD